MSTSGAIADPARRVEVLVDGESFPRLLIDDPTNGLVYLGDGTFDPVDEGTGIGWGGPGAGGPALNGRNPDGCTALRRPAVFDPTYGGFGGWRRIVSGGGRLYTADPDGTAPVGRGVGETLFASNLAIGQAMVSGTFYSPALAVDAGTPAADVTAFSLNPATGVWTINESGIYSFNGRADGTTSGGVVDGYIQSQWPVTAAFDKYALAANEVAPMTQKAPLANIATANVMTSFNFVRYLSAGQTLLFATRAFFSAGVVTLTQHRLRVTKTG